MNLVDKVVHANLRGGDVYADAQPFPLAAVQEGTVHNEVPERIDKTTFLCDRYELGRRNGAPLAANPACQSLDAADTRVANLFPIHDVKLFMKKRIAQFIAQLLPRALRLAYAGIEEHEPPSAIAFGLLAREVSAPDAFKWIETRIVNQKDADTTANEQPVVVSRRGSCWYSVADTYRVEKKELEQQYRG